MPWTDGDLVYPPAHLKRARPVYSCTNCRSKKLKCDRQTPCEKCKRSGLRDCCVYDAHVGSLSRYANDQDGYSVQHVGSLSRSASNHGDSVQAAATQGSGSTFDVGETVLGNQAPRHATVPLDLLESLQTRVGNLESAVYAGQTLRSNSSRLYVPAARQDRVLTDNIEFEIGSASVRAHPHKAIDLYEDVKSFLQQKLSDQDTLSVLRDLKRQFPKYKPKRERFMVSVEELGEKMLAIIPSQQECESFSEFFFFQGQGIYEILDRQPFSAALSEYWSFSRHERSTSHFTPCLLLVVVITSNLNANFTDLPSQYACDLVDEWISTFDEKQASELVMLQIQALLAFCLQVAAAAPPERVWRVTGNMVSAALIASLRNGRAEWDKKAEKSIIPASLSLSIVELDLQASLVLGLPPATHRLQKVSPNAGRADNMPKILKDTLPIRLDGAQFSGKTTDDVDDFVGCILTLQVSQGAEGPPKTALDDALCDVHIHRSILTFSRPLLQSPKLNFACSAIALSSIRILRYLHVFTPPEWSSFFNLCRQDIFQAMQTTCLMLRSPSFEARGLGADRHSEGAWNKEKLLRIAKDGLQSFIENLTTSLIGNYCKDLIGFAVIIASSAASDITRRAAMEAAFANVVRQLLERAMPARHASSNILTSAVRTDEFRNVDDSHSITLSNDLLDFELESVMNQTYNMDYGIFDFDTNSLWSTF